MSASPNDSHASPEPGPIGLTQSHGSSKDVLANYSIFATSDDSQHVFDPGLMHSALCEDLELVEDQTSVTVSAKTLNLSADYFLGHHPASRGDYGAEPRERPSLPFSESEQEFLPLNFISTEDAKLLQLGADLPLWTALWTAKKMLKEHQNFQVDDGEDPYSRKMPSH